MHVKYTLQEFSVLHLESKTKDQQCNDSIIFNTGSKAQIFWFFLLLSLSDLSLAFLLIHLIFIIRVIYQLAACLSQIPFN